jgi:NADH-quinone oxidoreductase subunit G
MLLADTKETRKTLSIHIDGQELSVPEGINLIEAAACLKKEVPHYCYHPKLSVVGNCRMCLLEVGMVIKDKTTGDILLDEEGQPKVAWGAKPVIGCGTIVAPGMHIRTASPLVKSCQEGVMELLLVNHPLDCPICDQAGECRLQEFALDYGKGYSRFVEEKNVKPKRTRLGERVMLDDERCILCSRCIRFMQEVPKDDVLGFVNRGSYSTLTCFPGKELNSNYSLNTVDICPVGALTSIDFRFKMRTWFLKRTPSICTESSVGVNTEVWSREGLIYRITPRRNDAVNDTWMPDSGRMLYKQVDAKHRIKEPSAKGQSISFEEAFQHLSKALSQGLGLVASGYNTVEEQHLLSLILNEVGGKAYLPIRKQAGDGLLISSDSRPNVRGAFATKLVTHLGLENLETGLKDKVFSTLLVYNEDLLSDIEARLLNGVFVIYIGTHDNATSQRADLVVPTLSVFEKSGSFINQQYRLQSFSQAVPGPKGVVPDYLLLARLLKELCARTPSPSKPKAVEALSQEGFSNLDTLWQHLGRTHSVFEGLVFSGIPSDGLALDTSKIESILTDEGPCLHYHPESFSR